LNGFFQKNKFEKQSFDVRNVNKSVGNEAWKNTAKFR